MTEQGTSLMHALAHLNPRRGFTLVEMLIVAALIVIFSTIAVFSMQELMESSRRKSAIADLRTVANTMSNAHMDIGFFPKVGYLGYGMTDPGSGEPVRGLWRGTVSVPEMPPGFDSLGDLAVDNTPFARRVVRNWKGPYLPETASRAVLSYSPYAYTASMRVPSEDPAKEDEIMAWPCDPWGNPYVVYLLHIDLPTAGEPAPRENWIRDPSENANYKAIAVSYGRNLIPGGPEDTVLITRPIREAAENYKLYKLDTTGRADFVALTPAEYRANSSRRLNALYRDWGYLDPEGVDTAKKIPGILDESTDDRAGSDDLVVPIP